MHPHTRIGILGPLEVREAGGQLVPVGGVRLRSFLIRLAIGGGSPVSADRLAEDLWPREQPADAANAIQALASRLRTTAGRDLVEYGPAGYRVAVAADQIDAGAFERLVTSGRAELQDGDDVAGAATLRAALELWRGPALADVADAAFAAPAIARLTELRLAATEDLIDADIALGRAAELVPEVEQMSAEYPLREHLRGQLMQALYAAGRQADALAVFEDTRRSLASELGIDPSPSLAVIHLAILRGEVPTASRRRPAAAAGGRAAASRHADRQNADDDVFRESGDRDRGTDGPGPAVAGPDSTGTAPAGTALADAALADATRVVDGSGPDQSGTRRARGDGQARPESGRTAPRSGNLPAQLTTFVGRDDELARVVKLLDEARLITLTGHGGAGKTRLALEVAARLAMPDGVWFVPLAPVRDAIEVPQAVLAAVDGRDLSWPADAIEAARLASLDPVERLCETLEARRLLLVLDNCEHVIEATATMAAELLAQAPGIRILATSREPLGVTGETLAPVPSLPLPEEGATPEVLAANAAVRLFADRAAAVRPGFTVDDASAGAVVRICRALDGIPLAIELAAARMRSLTADQVAARLDDRFALLSVTSRGRLPRHQTLRAIVDWSWDLLDDTERTVLRRLSVFSGGATPDSAQRVCWPDSEHDVVDVIAALIDKSLVTADGDPDVRYRLLETVRAYAAERLAEAGETEQVAAAHAGYFLSLAEEAEPRLRSRDQLRWLNVMAAEHDNFAAALRHLLRAGDGESALRFVGALAWYWITQDRDSEASDWATAAVALAPPQVPPELAGCYAVARLISVMTGIVAEGSGKDMQALTDVLGELPAVPAESAHPLLALAGPMLATMSGNAEGVRAGLDQIAGHADPWVRAARTLVTGHLAVNSGDIASAEADLRAGQVAFEEIGDRFGVMVCLSGLAEVAMARGNPAEAVRLLETARGIAVQGLAGHWSETVRVPLGRARAAAGDVEGGKAEIRNAVRAAERLGELDDAATGYLHLSDLARQEGDLSQARALLGEATAIIEPRVNRPDLVAVAASSFTKLGCICEQEGDVQAAAQWHRKALEHLAESPVMLAMQSNQSFAVVVEGIAALDAAQGRHSRAAELLGLAHTLQGYRNNSSLEVSRAEAASTLTDAEFDTAYAAGRQQSQADALALADEL